MTEMEQWPGQFTAELASFIDTHGHQCTICGHAFVDLETRHEGFDATGACLVTCGKCSANIATVARRYQYRELPYEVPSDNSTLWRYMDFAKYVSLLATKALYLARCDTFGDHFEGAKGLLTNKTHWDQHYKEFFRRAITDLPGGTTSRRTDAEINAEAARLLDDLSLSGELDRRRNYASCWHENEHESEAMWRLYSSYLENAVAIRTTMGRLRASLLRAEDIRIGRIKYLDFRNEYAGPNNSFWRKRMSFSHEREVRALYWDPVGERLGILAQCDLQILVDAVFVSPRSPAWLTPLVNDVNKKYGLDVLVSNSALSQDGFW